MENTYIKEGKFIPPMGHVTDAERLRAMESFLMRFSEETEYALSQLNERVSDLVERKEQGEEVTAWSR